MTLDSDIKRDVEAELKWDPVIDATDIAVAVRNGVVTLTGFVRSYAHRSDAEVIAKRVKGVVGIANDLKVRLANDSQRLILRSPVMLSPPCRRSCPTPRRA